MATKKNQTTEDTPFSLHRSSSNRIIAGVAGGLGEYFRIDATIIRIIFVLLTFFGGSGILIYLILWLVIPSDATTYSNPKDHIKENFEDLKESAQKATQDFKIHSSNHDSKRLAGIIIIVLGALFLLNSLGIFSGFYLGRLWPLILIILGLLILSR